MQKITFFCCILFLTSLQSTFSQAPSHDPSHMVKENGRYWIFSTGNGIWTMSSPTTSFINWRGEPSVFANGTWPSWINTYSSGFDGTFWAPEIIYMNNKWNLYYSCSTFGSQSSAIGLATTTSLSAGNWVDQGMVSYSNSSSTVNAIDPDIFKDYTGKVWLLYGSYWNGIVMTGLDSITGKPLNRNNITFVANGGCEAGHLAKHDGYYYLFFNRGACCRGVNSTYQIFMGRSTNPTGPFLDKNGIACHQNGGTSFLHSDGRFIGPGHFGLMDSVLTYHYYDGANNGASKLKVDTIKWVDGWPEADYTVYGGITNGTYAISNRNSQKILELQNTSTVDGTNVTQTTETGTIYQRWRFTYLDNKYYKISPEAAPDQALEVANCGLSNGDNVRIWTYTGAPCQEWYISTMTDGYFRITNRNSNQVLEIVNAYTNNGANAQQWPFNEQTNQQWIMKTPITSGVKDIKQNNVLVNMYPNPTTGNLLMEKTNTTMNENYHIKIYNSIGQQIYHTLIFEKTLKIDLSAFAERGIYFINITNNQGLILETKKITFNSTSML